MDWTFPDEAYHMNIAESRYLIPRLPRQASFFDEIGVPAQVDFNNYDKKVAMDRVMNTRRAKEGMEGLLNTTARSQRYILPASRSSRSKGVFDGSTMKYLTSAGLRGGRIYTKEGQEWLAKRLKERETEYAEIDSGNFSARPPGHIDVSPFNTVDTLLQSLFTEFGSGSFSSRVTENLNLLLSQMITIGSKITPSQLGNYARAVGKLREATRPYMGREMGQDLGFAYEGREKRFRNIDAINGTLKLIEAVIKEIARTIYDPLPAREQVMATLRERLLARQVELFQPGFAEEGRQAAIAEPFAPELGGPPQLGRPSRPSELLQPDRQTYNPIPAPEPQGEAAFARPLTDAERGRLAELEQAPVGRGRKLRFAKF